MSKMNLFARLHRRALRKKRLLNVVSGHGYVKKQFNVWLRCQIPFHTGPKRFGRTFCITCRKNKMPSSCRAIQKALKPSLWQGHIQVVPEGTRRAALRRASERQMRCDNVWQQPGLRPRLAIKLYGANNSRSLN